MRRRLIFALLLATCFHGPRWAFMKAHYQHFLVPRPPGLVAALPVFCKWDCLHFEELARKEAYLADPRSAAFFPLWPQAMGLLHERWPGLDMKLVLVVASNLLSVLAVALLILLGSRLWVGSRLWPEAAYAHLGGLTEGGLLLGLCLAIFPHAVVYSFGYSEALFMCLFAGSVLALVTRHWIGFGLLAGVAATCRNQGIWYWGLALAIVGRWRRRGLLHPERWPAVGVGGISGILLSLIPVGAFLAWQQSHYGTPWAFVAAQAAWNRRLDFNLAAEAHLPTHADAYHVLLYSAWWASWRFFKRHELHWKILAATTLAMAELPLFAGGFSSFNRFMSINLGIYLLYVELARRNRWVLILMLVLGTLQMSIQISNWLYDPVFHF